MEGGDGSKDGEMWRVGRGRLRAYGSGGGEEVGRFKCGVGVEWECGVGDVADRWDTDCRSCGGRCGE